MANIRHLDNPTVWQSRVIPTFDNSNLITSWLIPVSELLAAGTAISLSVSEYSNKHPPDLIPHLRVFVSVPGPFLKLLVTGSYVSVTLVCDLDDYFECVDNTRDFLFPTPPLRMMATATATSAIPSTMSAGSKRKRGNEEMGRNVKSMANDDSFSAALLQGIETSDDNTRTAQAALAGTMENTGYPDNGFDGAGGMSAGFGDNSGSVGDTSGQVGYNTPGQTPSKPTIGTPGWHQQRKESHKEGM